VNIERNSPLEGTLAVKGREILTNER